MTEKFSPAAGLGNYHLQTVFARFHRPQPWVSTDCHWFDTPDGDRLALHTPRELKDDATRPLVLILHGLEGSVASPYAQGLMESLLERGYQVAVMHFRGCGGVPNRLPRAYHSGDSEDPRWLAKQLKRQLPNTPLVAVGYSLGGNVLLKWLGEDGKESPLTAAVAISAPMDLHACARRIDRGLSRVYQKHLLACLRRSLRIKAANPELAEAMPDLDEEAHFRSFRHFDNAFTAPIHGFRDVNDYYTRASSKPLLRYVQVPTLIIHAEDDPFICPSAIPTKPELSHCIRLEVSAKGGHVGFIGGSLLRPVYWLEQRIPNFLESVLNRR
ncbi:hydrolase [Microbulbifer thermotolerans]|uniref:hydrolase n=1 Tax=Microbulbifer thermotolerans TaxID=252514 RepID=UPI00224A7479|nr:hydrolase [Microbulbifer thermotolerans]MCX2840114.1 hydrolase [Microbulbifer thermotolerans]